MLRLGTLAACLVAFTLSGCAAGGEGSASVYVKDAPADTWSAVHLTFTQVTVHQSASGSDNDTAGWKVIFSDTDGVTVDLLNASGSRAAFLGEAGLAPGHYQQIRITATAAHGVLKDGTGVDIALPQKDLKLTKSFRVEAGKETQIIIDFDLDKSLVQKGNAWEFKSHVGKVYAHVQDDADNPDEGEVTTVTLADDA